MTEPDTVQIQQIEEFRILSELHKQLRRLLHASFPEFFDSQTYAKQISTFRLLAWSDSELVAQCAIEHRVISIDGIPKQVFGIVDLCVAEPMRSKGLGARLLASAEQLAVDHGIDCMLLFTDGHQFYERHGFVRHDCLVHWLGVDEHKSIGLIHKRMGDCLMLKALKGVTCSPQEIDMLGYLF